jgi:hypothetical protein
MPFEFERDDSRKRLTVITSGVLTLTEMLSVPERQAAEGMWTYSMLSIARGVSNYASPHDMRALVAGVTTLAAIVGRRGPVAIVESRPAAFGMWRLYGTLADRIPLNVNVFRVRDAAEAWLAEQRDVFANVGEQR